jgi:hypothetical protein
MIMIMIRADCTLRTSPHTTLLLLLALLNAVINPRVPSNARKLSSFYSSGGLSCSAQLHRGS